MKIAVVGYGVEGVSSAKYWHALGHEVTICARRTDIAVPDVYAKQLGEQEYLKNLDSYDVIVRSAGIHPRILLENNPGIEEKITTNVEEFMRVSPTRNTIGVTGTKGKGTTSTLITEMLKKAGYTTHLVGNIGQPPLDMIHKIHADDWVVLELSSFQLEDFKGPSPQIAVCLMVVPEHLNWHATMDEYIAAKSNLFEFQRDDDYAIYYQDNEVSKTIATAGNGHTIAYYSEHGAHIVGKTLQIEGAKVCDVEDIKLLGKHNLQNACAAVTSVWQITPDLDAIASVLKTFSGLEHRLEFVREVNGVKYYDDSFATTPETAIAAIQSFTEPKVLILGGSDKGISLDPIADEVARSSVRHAVLIGDMAPVLESLLQKQGFNSVTTGLTKMSDIVTAAKNKAQEGDVVLLSTGCASYGLFKDYKDRAKQFVTAVENL